VLGPLLEAEPVETSLTTGLYDRQEFGEFADGRDEALCGLHESRRRMQVPRGLIQRGDMPMAHSKEYLITASTVKTAVFWARSSGENDSFSRPSVPRLTACFYGFPEVCGSTS
jgi:hypothetical protein